MICDKGLFAVVVGEEEVKDDVNGEEGIDDCVDNGPCYA